MMDVDTALSWLRELPVDPRLEAIDDGVFDALAYQRRHGAPLSGAVFGIAAGVALSIGLLGSAIPARENQVASIAPFGAPPALMPSTLLGTSE
ncbi:hypothetical protein N5J77_28865 [Sphingobium yanoikuyae]|uniref:Uncharacterized protein n=1 Tax=Sphingobium yanoikuyae TaxID=13690 RepID=A0AA42X0D5_SPHYA|nr:hypothetical protein [Sphingobium yanoikuyae]MDH2135144.1 hypothetical protein [Sphingobium yanoikuyae]MDH2151247.1 hypothetical protein [Sphingobium yanoikuyae]MDH2169462.1 hypothetical protein [Sphingobium yanoikuyae]